MYGFQCKTRIVQYLLYSTASDYKMSLQPYSRIYKSIVNSGNDAYICHYYCFSSVMTNVNRGLHLSLVLFFTDVTNDRAIKACVLRLKRHNYVK